MRLLIVKLSHFSLLLPLSYAQISSQHPILEHAQPM